MDLFGALGYAQRPDSSCPPTCALSSLSLKELAARALHAFGRLVQLAFWSSRYLERLATAAPLLATIAGTLERDTRTRALLLQLYAYFWQAAPAADVAAEDIRSNLLHVAGLQGAEDVVNAAEQLIEQGRAEGLERGLRAAIASVLGARSLPLSEVGRARLSSAPTFRRSRAGSNAPRGHDRGGRLRELGRALMESAS